MISLNTNVSAMNASRLLNMTNSSLEKTTERLSSGLRINRASDDASGLFAAESLTTQIRSSNAAIGNIQHANALGNLADHALSAVTDGLQRMRELALQRSSGLLDADQATALDNEYQAVRAAVDDIISNTSWGGTAVFGGTFDDATLQVGPSANATAQLDLGTITSPVVTQATIATVGNASAAMTEIDADIDTMNNMRAKIGAQLAGLEHQKAALEVAVVANTDARSRIRDADLAAEVSNLVQQQIKQQAGASALSAANFSSQFVISLLQ